MPLSDKQLICRNFKFSALGCCCLLTCSFFKDVGCFSVGVVRKCYHGDVSDVRHVCTKYHGHTYYYQQLIGCYVGNGAL